jgi:hypothetical protein
MRNENAAIVLNHDNYPLRKSDVVTFGRERA